MLNHREKNRSYATGVDVARCSLMRPDRMLVKPVSLSIGSYHIITYGGWSRHI